MHVFCKFQERYIKEDHTNCVISRAKPLDSAIRSLERKSVNLHNKLFVKFSGEIGEDHDGPRKEFFRYALDIFRFDMVNATVFLLAKQMHDFV